MSADDVSHFLNVYISSESFNVSTPNFNMSKYRLFFLSILYYIILNPKPFNVLKSYLLSICSIIAMSEYGQIKGLLGLELRIFGGSTTSTRIQNNSF